MDFYKVLQEIMDEKSLTIPEVARISDLSDSTVRSIIMRKSKKIALDVAIKLSKGLDVSLLRLIGEEEISPSSVKKSGDIMSVGDIIRVKRTLLNMTLEELAQKVGVSRQTIQRYETGVISNIPSDNVEKIAAALETTPSFLMGWEKDSRSPAALAYGGGGDKFNTETTKHMHEEKAAQDKAYREAKQELIEKIRLAELKIEQIHFLNRLLDIL